MITIDNARPLTLVMPPAQGAADGYNVMPLQFPGTFPVGTGYALQVVTAPAGQTCRFYQAARGTVGAAVNFPVRLGCERNVEHVSRSESGTARGTYHETGTPVVGGMRFGVGATREGYGEGRFVAFMSSTADIAGSKGAHRQIFWRDRLTGDTRLISAARDGAEGSGDSFIPSISLDGLHVAFESHATNLVDDDLNKVRDVFVWSAMSSALALVSASAEGTQSNGDSYEPSISGDGAVLAFTSGASNLATGVSGNGTVNVYRKSLAAGEVTLLSRNAKQLGVGGSRGTGDLRRRELGRLRVDGIEHRAG